MQCSEFLQIYSDYRDGLIGDPELARRVGHHLRTCPRCMNYDALVSRGVMALRSTSDIEPRARLRRRSLERAACRTLRPEATDVRPTHAGVMVAFMVLTAAATVIWAATRPTSDAPGTEAANGAAIAAPPVAEPLRRRPPAQVELDDWSVPAYGDAWRQPTTKAVSFQTWVASPR